MRIKRSLQATALIAAAVLLGLLTVQGTYALWNATATTSPGTVTAAAFDVRMTSTVNSQAFTNMTLPNDKPANLSITTTTLARGQSVFGGVVVTNLVDGTNAFNTKITATKGTIANSALAQNLIIDAKMGSLATDCSTPAGYNTLGTTSLTAANVAQNASAVFCLKITLNADPPQEVKGQTVNVPLTITASQCGASNGC